MTNDSFMHVGIDSRRVAELLPVRILAGLALLAVIAAFVYVFRHLKQIEGTISAHKQESDM